MSGMLPPQPEQVRDTIGPALLEFLRRSSRTGLLAYRVAKQNEVANLRRDLTAVLDQLLEQMVAAELASLFLDPPRDRERLGSGEVPSALAVRLPDLPRHGRAVRATGRHVDYRRGRISSGSARNRASSRR
jgi:hypothetical protein